MRKLITGLAVIITAYAFADLDGSYILPQDHTAIQYNTAPVSDRVAGLQRELREELGIEVAVGELVDSVTHQYPEKTVHLKFYRCVWVRNEPQAIGCQAFAWVGTPQLADYSFPAADTRLLEKLRNSLAAWC